MAASGGSAKVIVLALLANLGIALAKFVGWFFSGSASLLAEGIHSSVDCTNQVLLLIGMRASQKPPDAQHPLGYGRVSFFWSFIVAILLFAGGGLFAIYEGIHKLEGHGELSYPALGISILLVGIILETGSFLACLKEIRQTNTYPNLWIWIRKTTQVEVLVIFIEDLAALAGLVLAAVFLGLAWWTGETSWDAMGSIVIGVVLVLSAIILAVEIKSLMIGEAPSSDYRQSAERVLKTFLPGSRVLNLIALQTGSSEVMIAMKISCGSTENAHALVDGINRFEKIMKENHPEIRWQFVEPDSQS